MIYFYILLALAVLGMLYMRFEAGFVKADTIRFTKNKQHLKVIHLSDIHINHLKVPASKVRSVIEKEKPDMVIMTGDYIQYQKDIPTFLKFLDEIKDSAKIFACLGNHDYEAFMESKHATDTLDNVGLEKFIKEIELRGVTILHNRSIVYEKNSKKYNIIGFADYRLELYDFDAGLSSCAKDAFSNISFSHNPDIALEMPKGKVDYLFCGHFHGGQIWTPFGIEYKLLRKDKLCKMGVKKGLHKFNGINLYISRGLGCVLVPFRFMARPEITVVYIP